MSFFPRALAGADVTPGPSIEWEEPSCLLCGSRHWSSLLEAPDPTPGGTNLWFAVAQCQECGLCFTNPRPSQASIGQFYPAVYGPHRVPSALTAASRWFPWKNRQKTNRFHHVLSWHGQGRLLDFGCGGGSFLKRMHARGWKVTGLDVSADTVKRVRTELGLHALAGSLPHPELQPGSFDVITMWHSLEHVHAPREVLMAAQRLLAPGGMIVVEVPNIDSLPFRWYGPDWYGLDLPRHLTHFTPQTLSQMLVRTGYRVSKIQMVRRSSWMRQSARRFAHQRRSPYWLRWLTPKPLARLAAWYSYLTQQNDCILATAFV